MDKRVLHSPSTFSPEYTTNQLSLPVFEKLSNLLKILVSPKK